MVGNELGMVRIARGPEQVHGGLEASAHCSGTDRSASPATMPPSSQSVSSVFVHQLRLHLGPARFGLRLQLLREHRIRRHTANTRAACANMSRGEGGTAADRAVEPRVGIGARWCQRSPKSSDCPS